MIVMATLRIEMFHGFQLLVCESCGWATISSITRCCPACGERFYRARLVLDGQPDRICENIKIE